MTGPIWDPESNIRVAAEHRFTRNSEPGGMSGDQDNSEKGWIVDGSPFVRDDDRTYDRDELREAGFDGRVEEVLSAEYQTPIRLPVETPELRREVADDEMTEQPDPILQAAADAIGHDDWCGPCDGICEPGLSNCDVWSRAEAVVAAVATLIEERKAQQIADRIEASNLGLGAYVFQDTDGGWSIGIRDDAEVRHAVAEFIREGAQ